MNYLKTILIFLLFTILSISFSVPYTPPPPEKEIVKPLQMTPAQIRAKRLAEWYKAHPKKLIIKPLAKKDIANSTSLPSFCGNMGLFYGELKYHQALKVYYINQPDLHYDFQLQGTIKPSLLGKEVIIGGERNATYSLGGHQEDPFQSIIKISTIFQVVEKNPINIKKIKQQCSHL